MDASRQLIRWSIPGWLFTFIFVGLLLVTLRAADAIQFQAMATSLQTNAANVNAVAILAAAGVPIGFVIYQTYHYLYGRVIPLVFFTSLDRGYEVLRRLPAGAYRVIKHDTNTTLLEADVTEIYRLPILRVPINRLKPQFRNRNGQHSFEINLQRNWEVVRYYLTRITLETKSDAIHHEFITLSDIYHSLGASRLAILLAYVTATLYSGYKLVFEPKSFWGLNPSGTLIGMALSTIVLLGLWVVFSKTRYRALISAQYFLTQTYYGYFVGRVQSLDA